MQSVAAFADAAIAASGWRRTAAKTAAWIALLFVACYALAVFLFAVRVV